MNLTELALGSMKTMLIYIAGLTVLAVLLTAIVFWFFNRKKWLDITPTGPRWYKIFSACGAFLVALIIGLGAGFEIGLSNAGSDIISKAGPSLLNEGMKQAIGPLGIASIDEEIPIEKARLVLNNIKQMQLEKSSDAASKIINGAFNMAKDPFVTYAEKMVNSYSPGYKLSIASLTSGSWIKVDQQVKSFNRGLTISRLILLVVLVVIFGCLSILFCWALRKLTGIKKMAVA